MIFSKQSPRTSASLEKGDICAYSSGKAASMMLETLMISFHWEVFAFMLPTIPFSYGKLSSILDRKSQPAAEMKEGSGLGVVADLVVPLTI